MDKPPENDVLTAIATGINAEIEKQYPGVKVTKGYYTYRSPTEMIPLWEIEWHNGHPHKKIGHIKYTPDQITLSSPHPTDSSKRGQLHKLDYNDPDLITKIHAAITQLIAENAAEAARLRRRHNDYNVTGLW